MNQVLPPDEVRREEVEGVHVKHLEKVRDALPVQHQTTPSPSRVTHGRRGGAHRVYAPPHPGWQLLDGDRDLLEQRL